jgi:CheY-like chemotaxis protein
MHHTVMVIDDSKLELFLTETMIRNCKFAEKVISYHSASDALEYLRSVENDPAKFPEVIFVDVYMPVMTGFDFLDKFLEFPKKIKDRSKIIIFSSTQAHEDMDRMKKYPIISRFLAKPLSKDMFRNMNI